MRPREVDILQLRQLSASLRQPPLHGAVLDAAKQVDPAVELPLLADLAVQPLQARLSRLAQRVCKVRGLPPQRLLPSASVGDVLLDLVARTLVSLQPGESRL